jgi:hypothetical protein
MTEPCPLSTDDLSPFEPDRIMFRQIHVPENTNRSRYSIRKRAVKWSEAKRRRIIEMFLIEGSHPNHTTHEEYNVLDLAVYENACIVLMLSPDSEWEFAETPVVLYTEDRYCLKYLYGGLRFVDRGGRAHKEHFPGCRLIYFEARAQLGTSGRPYRQKLDYLVVEPGGTVPSIVKGRARSGGVIDPDIRHPGIVDDGVDPNP